MSEDSESLAWALVDRHVEAGRGDAVAVVDPRRSWTYTELAIESRQAAARLAAEAQVGPGDRVALLLHDSVEFVTLFVGALRLGALPTPISTLLRGRDVINLLDNADVRALVGHADLLEHVKQVAGDLARRVPLVDASELLAPVGGATVETAAAGGAAAQGPVVLLYGDPTGTRVLGVTHDAAAVHAAHRAWAVGVLGLGAGDRVFSTARLPSAYGLGTGLLFPLLAGATTCLLPDRVRPAAVFEALREFRPTVLCALPSLYRQMADDLGDMTAPRPEPFRGLRVAVSAGEPMPARLHERVRAMVGVDLLHGFLVTEALAPALSSGGGASRPGSVGRPVTGFEARILDEEGVAVGPETIGELELRGPLMATSYWRRLDETARGFRAAEGGAWLRTGDRAFVDKDGWYFHCGRTDGHFKVSGKWVAVDEVELALVGHAAVWECAVVGEEDGAGLTIPVAYVVTNVGHRPSQELGYELMEFVKATMSPYKYPRRIEFVDELPKDGAGRVQRWRLRAS